MALERLFAHFREDRPVSDSEHRILRSWRPLQLRQLY